MDLTETMKSIVAKGIQTEMAHPPFPGSGYVTEKIYMLLQLYLQNKGWNPSVELLQCFTELKEASLLPSAAYLQMMASRVALDAQGRLILRENGKIILPYEHFANAVMLKHMNGPHGLHLGLEGTIRAVMESYTIGRECFGMDKEFIVEVVHNCPNPACRYYKSQLELSHKGLQAQQLGAAAAAAAAAAAVGAPTYIAEAAAAAAGGSGGAYPSSGSDFPLSLSQIPPGLHGSGGGGSTSSGAGSNSSIGSSAASVAAAAAAAAAVDLSSLEKSNSKSSLNSGTTRLGSASSGGSSSSNNSDLKLAEFLRANLESLEGLSSANKDLLALHHGAWALGEISSTSDKRAGSGGINSAGANGVGTGSANSSNLGLEIGGVSGSSSGGVSPASQEKIVRAFAEIMKNMARMKTCVRPAMCKPYGKQSEALQKTLVDTIQLVQSLRSFLPPPHIAVSSWKTEDKHRSVGLCGLQRNEAAAAAAAAAVALCDAATGRKLD